MRPPKCISVEKAKGLQSNWQKSRGKEIERVQGYVDTREFWYSVAELQEYLDYVKEKSAEQGINNPGVRIYFGAYEKSEQKNSYSTVFFAPTMEKVLLEGDSDSPENNYEIDPLNDSAGGVPPTKY